MTRKITAVIFAAITLFGALTFQTYANGEKIEGSYSPYPKIEYGYSASVECGTVRYMSQMSSDSCFYDDYWGSWKSRAGYHCSTCSISMALSYIGINKTPLDILNYGNGSVYFGRNWGGAVVSSYTYDKLSAAVDRYCNGNGKYSPVIIHLNKYTSAGHFVIIIGRVSENVYQVLDPSISSTWEITIDGSTAVYKYPFGNKTITDTIDRTGRTDDIYQWYNSNAKLPGYLGECTTYPSYCNIKVSADTVARSLPCDPEVDPSSEAKESVTSGAVYTSVALISNSISEYWYKIDGADGNASYIRADKTEFVTSLEGDVIIFGATSPVTHIKGKPFPIKGTIASTYTDITSVEAWVRDSADTVITGGAVSVDGKSYVLSNSTLDYKVIFNDLDIGVNTYSIYATYIGYYVDGENNLLSYSERVLLYESDFNVYLNPASCTHSYEKTVVKEPDCENTGFAEYFCGLCASSYSEDIPATGHEYGELTVTKEPSCTEKGEAQHTCTVCEYTETVEIDPVPHTYLPEITPPTCTDQGYTTYTCTCGDTYVGDYVDALGHNYVSVITPPTETEQGYTTHTCACSDSYVDGYTDPLGRRGDLNRDGSIDVNDVVLCLDFVFIAPTEEQLKTADLDGNDVIDVDDVLICLDLCFAV